MAGRLEGKVAIITGAAAGQGRAGAIRFAQEGARLALCDINEEGLAETAELVGKVSDTDVLIRRTDVGSTDDVAAFADEVISTYDVIDVVYNNAGMIYLGMIEEMPDEDWNRVFAVNVNSTFHMVKHTLPGLRRSKAGAVINVSSGAGLAAPMAGMTAYCMAKGAVIALTRAQARELAPDNIRVNCLIPGMIDTDMPQGFFEKMPEAVRESSRGSSLNRRIMPRPGTVEEIAPAAVYLASDESSYMTGAIMQVDGGWCAA